MDYVHRAFLLNSLLLKGQEIRRLDQLDAKLAFDFVLHWKYRIYRAEGILVETHQKAAKTRCDGEPGHVFKIQEGRDHH